MPTALWRSRSPAPQTREYDEPQTTTYQHVDDTLVDGVRADAVAKSPRTT